MLSPFSNPWAWQGEQEWGMVAEEPGSVLPHNPTLGTPPSWSGKADTGSQQGTVQESGQNITWGMVGGPREVEGHRAGAYIGVQTRKRNLGTTAGLGSSP